MKKPALLPDQIVVPLVAWANAVPCSAAMKSRTASQKSGEQILIMVQRALSAVPRECEYKPPQFADRIGLLRNPRRCSRARNGPNYAGRCCGRDCWPSHNRERHGDDCFPKGTYP